MVYGPLLLRANYFSYAGNFCSSFIPTILRRNTNEHTQTILFILLVVLKITKNIVINIPPPETARRALTCVARACVASGICRKIDDVISYAVDFFALAILDLTGAAQKVDAFVVLVVMAVRIMIVSRLVNVIIFDMNSKFCSWTNFNIF